jgi:hypothetical protein
MDVPMQRLKYLVDCTVVLQCCDKERCGEIDRVLEAAGFEQKSSGELHGDCVRSLVREHSTGAAERVRDETCLKLTTAIAPRVGEWKAFVQVSGQDSAWATLQSGKPPRQGVLRRR